MTTGIRSVDEPDWAPPGGTSGNQMREVRKLIDAAFLAGLRERIEQLGDAAWITVTSGGTRIGWTSNMPEAEYYVSFGLEFYPSLPIDEQRWFIELLYLDKQGRSDHIGRTRFEAPYARDTELHLDLLMAWFTAHRRNVLAQGRNEDAT